MKGIYLQHEPGLAPIITHIKKWKMVKKQPTPDTASELTGCSSFDLTVASATARTRVNNCTLNKKQPINDEKIATNITPVQQTIDQQIISTLGSEYQPGEYSDADGPDADIFRTLWVIPPHPYRQKNIAGGESTQVRIVKELRTRGIDDEDEIAHLLCGQMIGYGANSYLQVRNGNVTV
ncbi:hypothetical protein BU792_24470, partial [Salmonella enterica]|nr:hypothetical protein [Salmonella enterica]